MTTRAMMSRAFAAIGQRRIQLDSATRRLMIGRYCDSRRCDSYHHV